MAKSKPNTSDGQKRAWGSGGFLSDLTSLLETLGGLAEKGQELQKSGTLGGLDPEGKLQGVYGFTIRTGLGDKEPGVKVEPFGNVRPDKETGRPAVHEMREPMVDVFEESDHVLVVGELPGISGDNVALELRDDILVITAARGKLKYRKEVLLPASFATEKMSHSCHNGILEVRLQK